MAAAEQRDTGKGLRGGLWRAPHTSGLGRRQDSCPLPIGPGWLLPCPESGWLGWAGRRHPSGPRGLLGVSKVTLRCEATAAAAGALWPPLLRLCSGSGSSRPGSAPARSTQHPTPTKDIPPGTREDPGRPFPGTVPSISLLPSSEHRRRGDVWDPVLPSLPALCPREGRLNFSKEARKAAGAAERGRPQDGREAGRWRAPRGRYRRRPGS